MKTRSRSALLQVLLIAIVSVLIFPRPGSSATVTMAWFGNSFSVAGWQDSSLLRWYFCNTCNFTRTDSLAITSFYQPSCWLDCHETQWPAFTKIDQGHYKYVLAQDGTWNSSSTAGLSAKAARLTNWANHAKGAGGTLLIEQIWVAVSPSSTQAMQDASDFFYDSVCRATNSLIIPSGHAWWYAHLERPNLLYADPEWNDGQHPGPAGAYLNVCCQYAVLTGRSPVGMPFKSIDYYTGALGIHKYVHSDSDALFLQTKAWEAYQEFYGPTSIRGRQASNTAGSIGAKNTFHAEYLPTGRRIVVTGGDVRAIRVAGLDGALISVEQTGPENAVLRNGLKPGLYLVQLLSGQTWQTIALNVGKF